MTGNQTQPGAPGPEPGTIDTGDVVLHRPTGERWVVAFVRDGRLSWCGWPEGTAALEDCELVEAATEQKRASLLRSMADMSHSDDSRCRYARWRLGKREAS